VDVNVLDIHTQILQRTVRFEAPEAYKMPLKGSRSDAGTTQQAVFLHQPVHLFMIDDPAFVVQCTGHVAIAVTTEFRCERLL
jgi:hypothetical protein